MRIVTFSRNGVVQHGTRVGNRILVHPTAASAVDLAMEPARHPAGEEVAPADVTLLSPVPKPGKIICIGLNYRAHAMDVRRQNIWRKVGSGLAEVWPRLGFDFRRLVCGAASADVRWSVV